MSEEMVVRKIQFTGKSTYMLSLPKKWVHEINLKAGDPVTIIRKSDQTLSILPNMVERDMSYNNEVTALMLQEESGNSLKRKIISVYLSGHNIISLRSKTKTINAPQRDTVKEVVRRNLMGTEIIVDASDNITIQILLSMPELSINTAIQRMFLISTTMHNDAMISLREQNPDLAKMVIKSDDEVDRFSLYLLRNLVMAIQNERMIHGIGLRNRSDCLSYQVAVKNIERVADHAASIADKSLMITSRISQGLFQQIDKMSNMSLALLTNAVDALLKRDYDLADSLVDKVDAIRSIENEIILSVDKERNTEETNHKSSIANIKLILEDIRRTAEHASDIAEAAMNQTISQVIEKQGFEDK